MGIRKAINDFGFVHIVKSTKTSMKRINVSPLDEFECNNYKNLLDVYYTPNTFSSPIRRTREYLWQLHRLYIDIDHKKGSRYIDSYEIVLAIEELVEKKIIPKPTEYIYSGRGIHVYWDINNCHVMLIDLWEKIEGEVGHQLLEDILLILSGDVGVVLHGLGVDAILVLSGQLAGLHDLKLGTVNLANGALEALGHSLGLMNITTNGANKLLHNIFLQIIIFNVIVFKI